jgi:adenylate cyclase
MKGPTPLAYEVAVETHIDAGEFQEAITEAERAVSLDSNDPDSHFAMGVALTTAGRHSEAVDSFKRAMRLDPFYQDTLAYGLGIAYFFLFEFEKAANLFERSFKSNPQNYVPLWFLTAAYAHLGRQREAEAAFAKLRELNPQYSYLSSLKYFMNFNNPANLKLLADGLEKAGMR